MGELEQDEYRQLAELDHLTPDPVELPLSSTVKDVLVQLETWILKTLQDALPSRVVEALTRWLCNQWAPYVPQTVLDRIDWRAHFWCCLGLTAYGRLSVDGHDYGLLPSLVGHVEVHPAGLQSYDGDTQVRW